MTDPATDKQYFIITKKSGYATSVAVCERDMGGSKHE